jgi:16S rRNA (guanine527-N7)-methyltransferase
MAKPTKGAELLKSPIRGPEDFAAAFDASRETLDRLAAYEQLLRQWQKTINLVAPSTLDAIWHRHFADSAQLLPLAPYAQTWVDLGSGAGFPGLVVAILLASPPPPCGEGLGVGGIPTADVLQSPPLCPFPAGGEGTTASRITLIDSDARKCAFLREVVRQTGIAARVTVDILSTRIEVAATQASLQGSDVVCARALAPLDRLLNLATPLSSSRTVGLFLKGRDAATELKVAEKMWDFNAELVTSRTDRNARIVVIRRLQPKAKAKE